MELENILNQSFHLVFLIVRVVHLDSTVRMITLMQLQSLKLVQQEVTAQEDLEQPQEQALVV